MTRSSILTLKKNTELKLGSKFKLPVEVDVVPYNFGIMGNVITNGSRLCRGRETS